MTYNNTLLSLSVAKNRIGDEGVDKLSKMFVKHAITSDELQQRKRFGAEIQRKSDEVSGGGRWFVICVEATSTRLRTSWQHRSVPPHAH